MLGEEAVRTLAVVGSGPAGLFAVEAALEVPQVARVDIYEALPVPFGLLRFGVAPDHHKTKAVVEQFDELLSHDRVRLFGNVRVGRDVTLEELRRHYDGVVLATGASVDRRMGVPGEDLMGSVAAARFVPWYSGHPESAPFELDGVQAAVVVGAGNVALDIVRILAKSPTEMAATDIPDEVLEALEASTVRDVHLLIRRGPLDTKFSPAELRELGELENADLVIDPGDLSWRNSGETIAAAPRSIVSAYRQFERWAAAEPQGKPRRVHVHFWTSIIEILGRDGRVIGVRVRHLPPGGSPTERDLDAELVVRSVGFFGAPILDLPFDAVAGTVPHEGGRVLPPDRDLAGCYVTGWIKRGPRGVIGTNRPDAIETVSTLVDDFAGRPPAGLHHDIAPLLAERGVDVVDARGWRRIRSFESRRGVARGAASVKLRDLEQLLRAAAEG